MYEFKIYRGVMCHDNEELRKFEEELTCQLKIDWYEEFDKFWPKHLKSSKIYTLMRCFWPKMFELKKVQRS